MEAKNKEIESEKHLNAMAEREMVRGGSSCEAAGQGGRGVGGRDRSRWPRRQNMAVMARRRCGSRGGQRGTPYNEGAVTQAGPVPPPPSANATTAAPQHPSPLPHNPTNRAG